MKFFDSICTTCLGTDQMNVFLN